MEDAIVSGIDTIKANTKTTHIHLSLREVLDTCRVVHVAQDMMTEGRLELITALLEESELTG